MTKYPTLAVCILLFSALCLGSGAPELFFLGFIMMIFGAFEWAAYWKLRDSSSRRSDE